MGTEHGVRGRVVIVTGSGQGLGRGMALHLAKNGAAVVVAERRPEAMASTVGELESLGAEVLGVVCDVADRASVDGMVAAAVERFGRLDALVNNAQSFRPNAPVATVTAEDLDVFYETGVKGTLNCMQAVYPHMAARRWGRIVNVASAVGLVGTPGFGAYAASKEAIRALTRTAAREWGRDGIVVNVICPGGGPRAQAAAARGDEAFRAFWKDQAVGYVGDAEDDIAPVVLFLCSDACRYMTGQTLMVDGGAFMFA
jgi:NAD(P)-dependent dehydrogenase (short-subunit alcohol dehydrogenase family)